MMILVVIAKVGAFLFLDLHRSTIFGLLNVKTHPGQSRSDMVPLLLRTTSLVARGGRHQDFAHVKIQGGKLWHDRVTFGLL